MPTAARWKVANSPKIPVKYGASCRADVGIGTYSMNGSFCYLKFYALWRKK